MASLFKRTKNLMKATIPHNDAVTPSIRSVVEMRQHLEQKYAALDAEYGNTRAKAREYSSLITLWSERMSKASSLVNDIGNAIRKDKANSKTASTEYEKLQAAFTEFSILLDTAREYVRLYTAAREKAIETHKQQEETLRKISDILYRLKSFERKYSLRESLHKVSTEISVPSAPEIEVQENREINRTLHTAEALLELKEEDFGWNFPALPK